MIRGVASVGKFKTRAKVLFSKTNVREQDHHYILL